MCMNIIHINFFSKTYLFLEFVLINLYKDENIYISNLKYIQWNLINPDMKKSSG